jgi:phosphopantothenoylcysteine decarboxylase / phosphopantothenate---cysteine ligase
MQANMINSLNNKQIVVGVTGGIAAYKSADLVRRLREVGASVRVVMTANAKEFITALTLQAVSGNPVHDDLFDLQAENAMGHIQLARWADAIVVAPASADFIARLVHGEANDLLTTLCLATSAPIVVAPAMNQGMWKNTMTQANVQALANKKIQVVGPNEGSQACGDVGFGRMSEPLDIVDKLNQLFVPGSLADKRVLITAGPTREAIDPIRYLSNASSGKMGYALATAAVEAGASVTLVSGPVSINKPQQVTTIDVVSAQQMFDVVMQQIADIDIFIAVAAVADYKCKTVASEKIAKKSLNLVLELERNPDIVATVASLEKKPFVIGFAAETNDLLNHAKQKLIQKKLDMIIANQVGESVGIDSDENAVTVLYGNEKQDFTRMAKTKLARELIAYIASKYHAF